MKIGEIAKRDLDITTTKAKKRRSRQEIDQRINLLE